MAGDVMPGRSQHMRGLTLFLSIAVALAVLGTWGPSASLGAGKDTDLTEVRSVVKKLQARYRNTKDLQADFTQRTRIEGFARPIFSTGRVYLKNPGKLRWDYHDPTVEQIYVNKNDVNMYVPAHKQVLVGELTKMTASRAPLQLLQGAANLEAEFTVMATDGPRGAGGLPLVTLLPKSGGPGAVRTMTKIVIEVQPKTYFLKTIAIYEAGGNVSTFEFSNLRPNSGLRDTLFAFQVPPGVEVVKAPVLAPP